MPKQFADLLKDGGRLTGPNSDMAFIAEARSLHELQTWNKIRRKLSLAGKDGTFAPFGNEVIVEFKFASDEPLAYLARPFGSPRSNGQLWLPGGYTTGGAREWVIDPEAVSKGLIDVSTIKIRTITTLPSGVAPLDQIASVPYTRVIRREHRESSRSIADRDMTTARSILATGTCRIEWQLSRFGCPRAASPRTAQSLLFCGPAWADTECPLLARPAVRQAGRERRQSPRDGHFYAYYPLPANHAKSSTGLQTGRTRLSAGGG